MFSVMFNITCAEFGQLLSSSPFLVVSHPISILKLTVADVAALVYT